MKNFNAKITRQLKKNPDAWVYLPERLSMKTLRREVTTRAEYNNTINAIERFIRKKNAAEPVYLPTGIVLTKWEKTELNRRRAIVNKQRAAELELAAPSPQKGNIRTVRDANLQPMKPLEKVRPGKDFEAWKDSVKKLSKPGMRAFLQEKYKENYLKTVRDQLGPAGEKLYQFVKNIPASKLVRGYYEDPVLSIQFVSPRSNPLDSQTVAYEALSRWREHMGMEPDPDLPELEFPEDLYGPDFFDRLDELGDDEG